LSDIQIDVKLKNSLSRPSVGKPSISTPNSAGQERVQKTLGDPPPALADIREFPDHVRQSFAYDGLLRMIERKLNALTGEKYAIVPAQGDRVCIDEQGRVFVGRLFMEENFQNHPLVAGVLAHEWGHFPTRRQKRNLDALSWDEVYKIRRQEETLADMFCGRALFMLGYPIEPLINYLKKHENPNDKSPKYHTAESRGRVIVTTYGSQKKRSSMASNLQFSDDVYGDPIHTTRLIGS